MRRDCSDKRSGGCAVPDEPERRAKGGRRRGVCSCYGPATILSDSGGNSNADGNAFFGYLAGTNSTSGANNTFIGNNAGLANTLGGSNTLVGANTNLGADNLTNTTAIGASAQVTQNNSLVLGSINGVNGATADTSVGIGTPTPKAKLDVTGGNILVGSPGQGIILKSPDGATCRLLSIDNTGVMVLSAIACP